MDSPTFTPGRAAVFDAARRLGMTLSDAEADVYREFVGKQLESIDRFLLSDSESSPGETTDITGRDRGHRPESAENRFGAWLWRCLIPGQPRGVLAGKRISFKDHIPVAGLPLSFGSPVLDDCIADVDATVVSRVLEAGGTIVGKNSLNSFLRRFDLSDPPGFGIAVNPHDPTRSPGWSSSGSAAAVAAREVDIAFGGDQAGSIRIPAAYCGVVGLKPTFGLVPHTGIMFGSEMSMDHVGPLALSVQDIACALEAVAGPDGLDPRQDQHVAVPTRFVDDLDGGISGLRIGILSEGFGEPIDRQVADVVVSAAETFRRAGATVQWVSVPAHLTVGWAANALSVLGSGALRTAGVGGAWLHGRRPSRELEELGRLYEYHPDDLGPRAKLSMLVSEFSRERCFGAAYARAQNARRAYIESYDTALQSVDLLLMPTCLNTAPTIFTSSDPAEQLTRELYWGGVEESRATNYNTRPFNYSGHPALTLPCGKVNGMPVGLQLVGRRFDEPLLLRAGYTFESNSDWEMLTGMP